MSENPEPVCRRVYRFEYIFHASTEVHEAIAARPAVIPTIVVIAWSLLMIELHSIEEGRIDCVPFLHPFFQDGKGAAHGFEMRSHVIVVDSAYSGECYDARRQTHPGVSRPCAPSKARHVLSYRGERVAECEEDDRGYVHARLDAPKGVQSQDRRTDCDGDRKHEQNRERVEPPLPDGYDDIYSECGKTQHCSRFGHVVLQHFPRVVRRELDEGTHVAILALVVMLG